MKLHFTGFIVALFLLFATAWGNNAMAMTLTSSAFSQGQEIPILYTGLGKDVSPPLTFSDVPFAAKSLVLIIDDPDAPDPAAPRMTWVHWVVYNIPPTTKGLAEGVQSLPKGAQEGLNDFKRRSYGGPHPPIGRHRYFHKLYALDTTLYFKGFPTKADVEMEMKGHVLSEAILMGTYPAKK